MLSIILLFLASVCNATMDTISHHWSKSIFTKIKDDFFYNWFRNDSWKLKYKNGDPEQGIIQCIIKLKFINFKINKPVQITDAWHFAKMLMIIFISLAIIAYEPFIRISHIDINNKLIELVIFGLIWNNTFTLFYKHIFKK